MPNSAETPIEFLIGAEVRRRNRVGEPDEKGSMSPSCEYAATAIVLHALAAAGFRVLAPGELDPETREACIEAVRETLNPTGKPAFIHTGPAGVISRAAAAIRSLPEKKP
jgi:hypothetical protein